MDRETFHVFYQETASALRAYLRLNCRNGWVADDLLQETYLRMLRQRLPVLSAEQRRAYLYKAAHSVLADHYRALRRETQWKAEHVEGTTSVRTISEGMTSEGMISEGMTSGEMTESAELDDVLELADYPVLDPLDPLHRPDALELPCEMQRIFDSLKAKQRTLLWLAYVEGFKHHEIAEVMGVKASSVRVLLSRARAELAAKLSDQRAAQRAAERTR